MDYDSILTAVDSNTINSTEFYKEGVSLPDLTVAMRERSFAVGGDSYVVGVMAVLFFVLAMVLYRHRVGFLLYGLKDFFTTKRQYADEKGDDNGSVALSIFLLIVTSVVSLSLLGLCGWVEQENPVEMPYGLMAALFVVGLCFVYLKAWLYSLVNWTFFDVESSQRWMSGYLFMTALTAFLFYPIALLDVFSPIDHEMVVRCVIGGVILYEILLFYKLLVNFKARKYGYLLNILYFCTVELLPTLVMACLAGGFSENVIVKNLFY